MDEVDFYLEDLRSRFKLIDRNKYVISYSGGKDSHLLVWFCKVYAREFSDIKIVSSNTFLEHPDIRDRMYSYADVVVTPDITPQQAKEKNGIPCYSKFNDEMISRYDKGVERGYQNSSTEMWLNGEGCYSQMFKPSMKIINHIKNDDRHKVSNKCCDHFKKNPLKKWGKQNNKYFIVATRSSESISRKKQKSCFSHNKTIFKPIWDLGDELIDAIYEKYNIPVPSIYEKVSRTGCMGCPYGRNIEVELSTLPKNQRDFIIDYFKESYDVKGVNYQQFLEEE